MVWSLSVTNRGEGLAEVAKQHEEIVAKVLKLLKEQELSEDKIQTAAMQFGENWEYVDNSRIRSGYFASTDISFTLEDFDRYQPLWMGLAEIDAVSVRSVGYDHSERIRYQNETREKAVKAAREKAKALAEGLGSDIAEPLLIEEDLSVNEGWGNVLYNNRASEAGSGETGEQIAPGRIPIKTRVKVAFRLVNPDR